ncbi:protein of unknown function [Rhodovastum atsumiense]|nr:protein of unknown function [Rhodovastum atsumiense]
MLFPVFQIDKFAPDAPVTRFSSGSRRFRVALLLLFVLRGFFRDIFCGILRAAGGALDLALGMLALAFGCQLGAADDLAERFLNRAKNFLGFADDTIFIHFTLPLLMPVRAISVSKS